MTQRAIGRRGLIGRAGLLALAALPARRARADMALAGPMPGGVPILAVAGPEDSDVADIGRVLRAPLAGALEAGEALSLRFAGGRDGVVGSNHFDASAAPDGETALLLPGAAMVAAISGSTRVHFDPAHWLPLLGACGSGVLMARPMSGGDRLRLACGGAEDPAVAALLALDLLGEMAVAVPGERNVAMAGGTAIALPGGADRPRPAAAAAPPNALFVFGTGIPRRLPALAQAGFAPMFSLGDPLDPRLTARDPVLPTVPSFIELLGPPARGHAPLLRAWQGLAAASLLTAGLVVPALAPQAALSRWRRATAAAASTQSVLRDLAERGERLAPGPASARLMALAQPDAAATAQFRAWLGARLATRL